jgi:serine/threonine protein kinase
MNELNIMALLSLQIKQGWPNFVQLHRVFTCIYKHKKTNWSEMPEKAIQGVFYYTEMELVSGGDGDHLITQQNDEVFPPDIARCLLFQVAAALYILQGYGIKHYDLKLQNVFIQCIDSTEDSVLLYSTANHGFASAQHAFKLTMPPGHSYIAKIGDFGTSEMSEDSEKDVKDDHFTTLVNTPPEYFILGDKAKQGSSHDMFGLGIIMLHLFTGYASYEQILKDVQCPQNLKTFLEKKWQDKQNRTYSVICSMIQYLEYDEIQSLYDTLYRFLVLFGIPVPDIQSYGKNGSNVLKKIHQLLGADITYETHCNQYSIRTGNNEYIARARHALEAMDGGLDLLLKLCSFNPSLRGTAEDVLIHKFMETFQV